MGWGRGVSGSPEPPNDTPIALGAASGCEGETCLLVISDGLRDLGLLIERVAALMIAPSSPGCQEDWVLAWPAGRWVLRK